MSVCEKCKDTGLYEDDQDGGSVLITCGCPMGIARQNAYAAKHPEVRPLDENKNFQPRRYLRICPRCGRNDYMARADNVCEKCQDSLVTIAGMIKLLQEIHESLAKEKYMVGFPIFLTADDAREELSGYTEQESDLPSFEREWVDQSCGMGGDAWHGYMIYPYEDVFIKVSFD